MVSHTPGHIIHYRQHGSPLPPWPAVICTEDIASKEFLSTRPPSYVTLVLLVGENLNLRWALTSEMNDYDPHLLFKNKEQVENTPGLGEAYALADSAREAGLGLDHWKEEFQRMVIVISSDEEDTDMDSEDSDMDDEMRKAVRASRADFVASRRSTLPMSYEDSDFDFERDMQRAIAASKQEHHGGRMSCDLPTPSASPPTTSKRHREPGKKSLQSHGVQERCLSRSPSLESFLTRNHSPISQQVGPTRDSDILEEDISESKEYVEFLVGPDREPRNILKVYVDTCPTFQRNFYGASYLALKGNNSWAIDHPNLREIDPRDFEFVVQFLETGDFGMRFPENDEENKNAIAECGAAWDAAYKLGMDNLLDHISRKAQRLAPWDHAEVLWFAIAVYKTAEASSTVQEELRAMLSTYMAEHFWEYINDDGLSAVFQERVRQLATLGRDIHARISTTLGQQSPPGQSRANGVIEEDDAGDVNMG